MCSKCLELIAERDALKGDAERYRFLRREAWIPRTLSRKDKIDWPKIPATPEDEYPTYNERFDASVDAIRSLKRPEKGEAK